MNHLRISGTEPSSAIASQRMLLFTNICKCIFASNENATPKRTLISLWYIDYTFTEDFWWFYKHKIQTPYWLYGIKVKCEMSECLYACSHFNRSEIGIDRISICKPSLDLLSKIISYCPCSTNVQVFLLKNNCVKLTSLVHDSWRHWQCCKIGISIVCIISTLSFIPMLSTDEMEFTCTIEHRTDNDVHILTFWCLENDIHSVSSESTMQKIQITHAYHYRESDNMFLN